MILTNNHICTFHAQIILLTQVVNDIYIQIIAQIIQITLMLSRYICIMQNRQRSYRVGEEYIEDNVEFRASKVSM